MTTLPRWAADILGSPPRDGGLNRWLLRASIALRRCGRSEPEIAAELSVLTAGEPTKPGEIERAVARSADYLTDGIASAPRAKKWPDLDPERRQAVIDAMAHVGEPDLWEASPRRLLGDGPDAEVLIDLLFPGNPLVCCANALHDAKAAPREDWRGRLAGMQFIVPSAMSAVRGLNKEGRSSARCLDNTGPRRFFVVEQDDGTPDEQARVLLHLAKTAPLAMAVHSGGKSLHGWFSCRGASEQRQRLFFSAACKLGADPATGVPCQLVRLPEGRRDNGNRQRALFLNPEAI
ncbi:MAG: hypothetical protein AAGH88_15810 [Planctomycetota bacterium]